MTDTIETLARGLETGDYNSISAVLNLLQDKSQISLTTAEGLKLMHSAVEGILARTGEEASDYVARARLKEVCRILVDVPAVIRQSPFSELYSYLGVLAELDLSSGPKIATLMMENIRPKQIAQSKQEYDDAYNIVIRVGSLLFQTATREEETQRAEEGTIIIDADILNSVEVKGADGSELELIQTLKASSRDLAKRVLMRAAVMADEKAATHIRNVIEACYQHEDNCEFLETLEAKRQQQGKRNLTIEMEEFKNKNFRNRTKVQDSILAMMEEALSLLVQFKRGDAVSRELEIAFMQCKNLAVEPRGILVAFGKSGEDEATKVAREKMWAEEVGRMIVTPLLQVIRNINADEEVSGKGRVGNHILTKACRLLEMNASIEAREGLIRIIMDPGIAIQNRTIAETSAKKIADTWTRQQEKTQQELIAEAQKAFAAMNAPSIRTARTAPRKGTTRTS